jgi:hypothetical protein
MVFRLLVAGVVTKIISLGSVVHGVQLKRSGAERPQERDRSRSPRRQPEQGQVQIAGLPLELLRFLLENGALSVSARHSGNAAADAAAEQLERAIRGAPPPPLGAGAEELAAFQSALERIGTAARPVPQQEQKKEECAICLQEIDRDAGETEYRNLRCGHGEQFHQKCIDQALKPGGPGAPAGLTCPVCRHSIAEA